MTDNTPEENKSNALSLTNSEIYRMSGDLMMQSENVRWTRLNTLLVVDSIFLLAWAAVFAGTEYFCLKPLLLTLLCLPGASLGVPWAFLGDRSSKYLDDFHDIAKRIEELCNVEQQQRCFGQAEERRDPLRRGIHRFTSSRVIVTWLPILFSAVFLLLVLASWLMVH